MSSKFRDILENRIKEEALERGDNFVNMRNGDPHENGIQRGFLMALKEVLTWSQEIERKLNDA
jgi:hypothetical protein